MTSRKSISRQVSWLAPHRPWLAFPPLRQWRFEPWLRAYSAGLRAGFTPASLFSAAVSGTWIFFCRRRY
jgi:hypothetical protein